MHETKPSVPVGFKFRPSDEELIEYYLYKKVLRIPIPHVDYIVQECDLYGEHDPGDIWKAYGGPLLNHGDDLYFFTKLKKKTPKGSRINRRVGAGAWQGEDGADEILSSKSQLIGWKKRFRYEKEKSKENGCWKMHEYTLDSSLLGQNQSTNYVLCRIRKNQPTGKKKKSASTKKRKLQDFQSRNRSVEPEMFLTQQENKQVDCLNNVEFKSYEASMGQQEASYNTDMMIGQSFQKRDSGGIDYSCAAGAGQYEVRMGMAVPDQTTQTSSMVQSVESQSEAALVMIRQKISSDNNGNFQRSETGGIESSSFAEQNEAPVAVVPDHQTMMLQQQDEDHPLSGIPEEDFCMLRKKFPADEFDSQPIGESGPSASVGWVALPDQTVVCEIPQQQHVSEENLVAPRTSVDWELPQLCEVPQLPCEEDGTAPSPSGSVDWVAIIDDILGEVPKIVSEDCCLSLDERQPLDPSSFVREDCCY